MKIILFETFSGYGGASFALEKAKLDYKCIGYSEIDKNGIKCYDNNFPGRKNFGDISKIEPNDLPDFNFLTGGFPCQDVSIAGKRDLSKGRTNLYLELLRIAKAKKPKYMLFENVKGLLSMGKIKGKVSELLMDKIVRDLKSLGYGVIWKCLNSKDYGIPQNRERVWFVCKLGGWDFMEFQFPKEEKLKIFLKDILEDEVDEKYYLKEEYTKKLIMPDTSYCIDANYAKGTNVKGYLEKKRRSPTLNTMQGGHRQPFIVASRGRNKDNPSDRTPGNKVEQRLEPKFDGTSNCISTVQKDNWLCNSNRIRKLTPKECFRLMGFIDDKINLDGISNSQQYHLAGNGWETSLVSKIFKEMFNRGDKE